MIMFKFIVRFIDVIFVHFTSEEFTYVHSV